jgi:hypothetical protein
MYKNMKDYQFRISITKKVELFYQLPDRPVSDAILFFNSDLYTPSNLMSFLTKWLYGTDENY